MERRTEMKQYLLGVDSGTTGVKAKIYDLEGNVQAESYIAYDCVYVKPGWVEQSVEVLRESLYDCIAMTVKQAVSKGITSEEIVSIGFSTQRNTHIYLDREGNILRNGMAISWQDGRSTKQEQWMRGFEEKYFAISGLPVSTAFASCKIRWVMENEPETFEKTAKIISTQEYFLHEFGAQDGWFQDWSNASQFGFMDIHTMEISSELCSIWGLERSLFPELIGSGWKMGTLNRKTAERTGLKEGMAVCSGGGDQQCAGIGAGVLKEGQTEITLGTAGISLTALDSVKYDANRKLSTSAHAMPEKKWESEGLQNAAASSYRWLRDNMVPYAQSMAGFSGRDAYDVLNSYAAKAPVGSGGVIFSPYLAGSACPNFNSQARGSFMGLSLKTDFGCLVRAVLEGVALETKAVLKAFENFVEIDEISLSGGATKSELWCQIQSDIYNRKVDILLDGDCSVLGAAILGGYGAGIFSSMEEAVERMVKKVKSYEPNSEHVKQYEEIFAIYEDIYRAVNEKNLYSRIAEFQQR